MTELIKDSSTMILFQFAETSAIPYFKDKRTKKNLETIKPKNFDELCHIYVLSRKTLEKRFLLYTFYRNNPKRINYKYSFLKEHLVSTNGVIIYAEQITNIISSISGIDYGIANTIRLAMGTKNINLLTHYFKDFKNGCLNNEKIVSFSLQNNKNYETVIDNLWSYLINEVVFTMRYAFVLKAVSKSYCKALELSYGKFDEKAEKEIIDPFK